MLERLFWNQDARKRLARLDQKRPWDRPCPKSAELAHRLKGMLGQRESLLFYYLARSFYSGHGAVVDAGSFLGKSASLFAAGLSQNPVAPPASRKVHCYDNFRVNESVTVDFLRKNYGRELAIGESTRELFDNQTAPFRTMLKVHAGDFHQAQWMDGPIEILMVDIAKSQSLWAHLLAEMFPSLVPGVSVVILQDYHHKLWPRINIGMEFLSPFFELVFSRVDDSAVFLCREAISPDAIARLVADDFTPQERIGLIDRAIARLAPADRYHSLIARIQLRMDAGDDCDDLMLDLQKLVQGFGEKSGAYILAVKRLQTQIEMNYGWQLVQSGNWPKALWVADRLLLQSNDGLLFLMRGCALNGLSRYREAEDCLREYRSTGTQADQYVPVELARAVMHQQRFDEAEQILVESLSNPAAPIYERRSLKLHTTLLRDILAARGDERKSRATIEKLKAFMDDSAEK